MEAADSTIPPAAAAAVDGSACVDGTTAVALPNSNSMAAPSGTGVLQHGSCRYGGVSASQGVGLGRTGRAPADPDAGTLAQLLEQHWQALTQDAVGHLLTVKGHMLASMDAAVESERNAGTSRLAAKQAEVDILKGELHDTQQQLSRTDRHLDRLCAAYAEKQKAVLDTRAQLRAWYVWRGHIARQRRLARQAMQAEHYYVKRWLLGRAWDRWAGRVRSRYRQLVIQRAEQQHEEDAAALTATHALEVAALRAEVEALQEQLQQEAAARNRMEEDMKRAFMRGVTAINLEAVQMMRRGAPPSGTNPFPVTVPLNAGTAASGLAAAQQQHMQQLAGPLQQQASWQDGAACDGGRDICSTAAGLPQQQQQVAPMAAGCSPGAARSSTFGQATTSNINAAACTDYTSSPTKEAGWNSTEAAAAAAAGAPARHIAPGAAGGRQQRHLGLATWSSVPGACQMRSSGAVAAAAAAVGVPVAADGSAALSCIGAHSSKLASMPAATAQAGLFGFGTAAGNSIGPAVLQQPQSCNGGPRVVIERGPAAGGGSRATGQPRHVAGGHAAAGGSKVAWGPTKRQT